MQGMRSQLLSLLTETMQQHINQHIRWVRDSRTLLNAPRLLLYLVAVASPFLLPQVLAIRTSTLEEKATACNMIVCYLDELKEGFFPYVQEVGSHSVCGGGGVNQGVGGCFDCEQWWRMVYYACWR
jgi:hypothetical protein